MRRDDLNRFTDDELDLVPWEFIQAAVEVFENGAAKYGRHSWEEGKHYEHNKNIDSIFHHICDGRQGLLKDKDSGLDPMAHAGVRCFMRYTLNVRANRCSD